MPRPTSITVWGIVAAALALALTAIAWWLSGGGIFSPGDLSDANSRGMVLGGISAHSELSRECGACHVAPWSRESMAERCLACHTDVRQSMRDTTTVHGMLRDARECLACHTEHRGPGGTLTRIEDAAFPHERFGFSLAQHRRTADDVPFTCTSCHDAASYRFPPERCESCHREYQPAFVAAHEIQWGRACMDCHDGVDRFSSDIFAHDEFEFPLTGAHARLECAACHHDVRTLAGFRSAPVECIGCHRGDDAHHGEFGPDCGSCHSTQSWEDVTFRHTFPLTHGRRQASACVVCHADAPDSYRTYTCYGCHEHTPARIRAEHLEEGIRDFQDCVACHPTGREHEGERRRRR